MLTELNGPTTPFSHIASIRRVDKLARRLLNPLGCVAFKMGRLLGKRVGGSEYWRIGVWGSKTAFRHCYNDQEASTEPMTLCKRRHADPPTRRYVSPTRLLKFANRLKIGGLWRWGGRFDTMVAAIILSLVRIEKEVEREEQGLRMTSKPKVENRYWNYRQGQN